MISLIAVGLVALLHLYILYLEMFLWTSPRGLRAFSLTKEFAEASKSLAANQGLYNGFLAAGLIWGILYRDPSVSKHIEIFFLACVIVAALYGGATAKKSILLIQGLPGLIALLLVLFLR
ncbi:DUF1304 domain-containing protein [Paenibacillus sp. N3.4]|uniref:DUF1304 domain-containing protein n=1 Tax=Paenibacillus sp. N3.4 TaxID=2603222 RepID=UPI0011C83E2A|nr:DUF1304 domain-containing protein [Paenibacillus sp. N3.4]TXK81872.1 DUF1304 domain-containing protein [Paenibacillus sp. N3.4]